MQLNVESIPEELRALRQWVGWKLEQVEGEPKPTKVPKNPGHGRGASHSNPAHWDTFDAALQAVKRFNLTGIGFVFSKDDPYCGIDLDQCRDPQTGQIEPWAQRWIDHFRSYTEVSHSGTGIHIIVKGTLPGKGRKKANYEVYDRTRFFAFTGHKL